MPTNPETAPTFSGLCQLLPLFHPDTSDVEVGTILSQRSADEHPCTFFSWKLSPAEHNYDVGNCELLAVKLALEECRHWLEGAEQPFLVWTENKNLEYIRVVKRLNSRQARWALFFTRFDFSLSYHPGSCDVKPDALSWQLEAGDQPRDAAPTLPQTVWSGQ